MVSNRLQDYLPVVTQLLNQSGGSGYNYNPVAPTSVQGGIVETGTRQNPTIRPAIKVSGPNQQVPKTVGTVTDPGMVGRNVDLSGAYELNPGEVVMDGKVVSDNASTGIMRGPLGALDWVTGNTWDFDNRGDDVRAAQGGVGRTATLDPAKVAEIERQITGVDPLKPTTSPVMTDADVMKVIQHENQYRDLTQGSRLAQRNADFEAGLNEVKQFLPVVQEALLNARLNTEAYSPSEIQSRQKQAASTRLAEAQGMALYQQGANNFGAPAATIGRRFG